MEECPNEVTAPSEPQDESPRSSTTPVISVEEYEEVASSQAESPGEDGSSSKPMFLQVPDFNFKQRADQFYSTDPVIRRFSTGSQPDKSSKRKLMKRRDTPPLSDPIFKLHLSPRASRKVIKGVGLDSVSESVNTSGNKLTSGGKDPGGISTGRNQHPTREPKRGEMSMLAPTKEHMEFIERALSALSPAS